MKVINLFDSSGIKAHPLGGPKKYKNINYVDAASRFKGITVFTDFYIFNKIVDTVQTDIKIAWILEPKVIYPSVYHVYKIENKFNYIFTFDEELLNRGNKYKFVPVGGCWIPEHSIKIHDKSKNFSFIFSHKKGTIGHVFRYDIFSIYKNLFDCFGSGVKPIQTKDIALNEYKYSVCVENSSVKNYFTEKIIDCFLTGTIPIYYGCKNIGDFFNIDGIFCFNCMEDLHNIINSIDENTYYNKLPAIRDNFERAKKYCIIEDWIYENIYSKI